MTDATSALWWQVSHNKGKIARGQREHVLLKYPEAVAYQPIEISATQYLQEEQKHWQSKIAALKQISIAHEAMLVRCSHNLDSEAKKPSKLEPHVFSYGSSMFVVLASSFGAAEYAVRMQGDIPPTHFVYKTDLKDVEEVTAESIQKERTEQTQRLLQSVTDNIESCKLAQVRIQEELARLEEERLKLLLA